jgi:hypothetical protein
VVGFQQIDGAAQQGNGLGGVVQPVS